MGERKARVPPRWFVVSFWHVHRWFVRVTGARRGLWRPRPGKWGALRLTTTGRRSGEPRHVIIGYYEDGPNLVSMAMNGWGAAEPAWWLNLQAHPEAVVELAGGIRREVLGRGRCRRGARAALGTVGRDRSEPRRLCLAASARDGGRRARAARRVGLILLGG